MYWIIFIIVVLAMTFSRKAKRPLTVSKLVLYIVFLCVGMYFMTSIPQEKHIEQGSIIKLKTQYVEKEADMYNFYTEQKEGILLKKWDIKNTYLRETEDGKAYWRTEQHRNPSWIDIVFGFSLQDESTVYIIMLPEGIIVKELL